MKKYTDLFSKLDGPEPPVDLAKNILIGIEQRERRILMAKMAASAVVFCASLWTIAVGYLSLADGLTKSGFFSLFSLLFSDFSSITANLPDFAFSMIESFPLFSAAIVLGGIGFAIWSFALFIDETSLMEVRGFSLLK
jgi:hypothetical protein